jgi:putative transposase
MQVVLKGTAGEMEPASSPEEVDLTLSEASPRLYSWEISQYQI